MVLATIFMVLEL